MKETSNLRGVDLVWIGSDRDGHVGAFITAGQGPVPVAAVNETALAIEDIDALLLELPIRSEAQILVSVPRPEGYIDYALRGLFVYDWTDIHKTNFHETSMYEPVAIPINPINRDMLSSLLQNVVQSVEFVSLSFQEQRPLNVRQYIGCL